jgi:hypothetical protein
MDRRTLFEGSGRIDCRQLLRSISGGGASRHTRGTVREGTPRRRHLAIRGPLEQFVQCRRGRLVKIDDPLSACRQAPDGAACQAFFKQMRNPYFISDNPALTETSGWVDAWTSAPSAYVVKVQSTAGVVATVDFARENNLRLVIKGGGHSYQGTSDAPRLAANRIVPAGPCLTGLRPTKWRAIRCR